MKRVQTYLNPFYWPYYRYPFFLFLCFLFRINPTFILYRPSNYSFYFKTTPSWGSIFCSIVLNKT